MDFIMDWPEQGGEGVGISGDRRSDRRYRIQLDLRWKLIRRRKVQDIGAGHTLDLSSGGICFDAGRPLPVGLNVELSIAWPVLLHNVAAMQLAVSGRIVRSQGLRAAVRISHHEFRTLGGGTEPKDSVSTMRTSGGPSHGGYFGAGRGY
jgi:hypothetical protein